MDVRLPRLGEGADSGVVATIFVKEGDTVKKDQPILELESEKAVASIPTPVAGTITNIYVKEGDEIKVGALIFSVAESGAQPQRVEPVIVEEPVEAQPEPVQPPPAPLAPPSGAGVPGIPPPASPSIRRIARELGIDLTRVRGSEKGGRIVMADLRNYIARLQAIAFQQAPPGPQPAAPAAMKPAPVSIDFSKWGRVEKKKMSQLRKAISTKMVESWTTIPHVTQFENADITEVLALRKKFQKAYEKKNANLTLTPFLLKAVVATLKKHPLFNASIDEVTEEIVFKNYYHIGIAVDTEQGLLVPVIRDVDKKSLLELALELQQLADRTRQRKVALEEMQGGTFTISNQGGIGGAHFTPIINRPEVAILGVGRGAVQPVIHGKKLVQRTVLPLGLSYDHRLIDGANAARFITDLVAALQSFQAADVNL
ncbi:MAG: branched-chain alpha-keto acid dehydrogenase subunit E2 [Ignavibacteria bacterium]